MILSTTINEFVVVVVVVVVVYKVVCYCLKTLACVALFGVIFRCLHL